MKKTMSILAIAGLVLALAPAAQAAVVEVDSVTVTTTGADGAGTPGGGTPQTKIIDTITVGATTYDTDDLVTGTSSGAVGSGVITNLDNFDVNLAGSPSGNFTTDFGSTNLIGAQFFAFEVGGNDALSVKAIFFGGGTGDSLTLVAGTGTGDPHWGDTGVNATDGYRTGDVYGLRFNYTDLLLSGGGNLTNEVITGLEFTHDGVDAVNISAMIPEPATMSLLAIGGIGLLVRRRRRRA